MSAARTAGRHSHDPMGQSSRDAIRQAARERQVLLLQPWVEDFYSTSCRTQPLGLAYLAGSLRARFPWLDVEIYDALSGGRKRTIPWPREFEYLKPFYGQPDKGPFSLFHHYRRFGRSDEEIRDRLRRARPFLVGISSLFTPYYRESLSLARLVKEVHPDVPVVMGGNHATLHPCSLLSPAEPFRSAGTLCDFVLRGEGEETICELVEHVLGARPREAVRNLVTRETVQLPLRAPVAPDRSTLAEPDFRGLQPVEYSYGKKPMAFLVTSRSCPHRCTFCSIHAVFGARYEVRAVDAVVQEIVRRYHQGVRHFDVEDDNFSFRRHHTLELLDRIIELKLPITFSAMNGLSYFSLDAVVLEKMREAGFESVNISLVSSDEAVLRFTRRPHRVEHFRETVRCAALLGLPVTAYAILGMPGQTVDEMLSTLLLLSGCQCLVGASPFYFTPGSPIHERERHSRAVRLASAGSDPLFSARLTALDLESDEFDRLDVVTCFRFARVLNHVKRGIDRGLRPRDDHFLPAAAAIAHARWHAVSGSGSARLPFSPRVAALLRSRSFTVSGHCSPRALRWDADAEAFTAITDGNREAGLDPDRFWRQTGTAFKGS